MRRVRIEIKSEKEFIGDLMKIAEKIDRGEAEPTDEMVLCFENFETFSRLITPDRLKLISVIKQNEPIEIEDLAELVGMNTDLIEELKELEILGLVEFDNSRVRVPYEEIVINLKNPMRNTSKMIMVKRYGRLKNLKKLAKVLDELEEGEEEVIEGIDYVEVVIVSDEKPKREDVRE